MILAKHDEKTEKAPKWWERATNARMHSNIVCGSIYELDVLYAHQSAMRNLKSLPMVSVAPSQFFYADAMQKPIGKG